MEQQKELFSIPEQCPICFQHTEVSGDFLFCRNKNCSSKLFGLVQVWVNRLGLLNWGDAFIKSICDSDTGAVKSVADLYSMSVDTMAQHCSGVKLAQKCYKALHDNKSISLELMLSGLNIPNLGLTTSTDIVSFGYDTIEKVLSLTVEDLLKIPNIGEITAEQVVTGLQERRGAIADLISVLEIKKPTTGKLNGQSFCVTGATSVPRNALHKLILDNGGIVKSSVVKGLSFLVTNEDRSFNSTKMQKAEKSGVKVISEAELRCMFNE